MKIMCIRRRDHDFLLDLKMARLNCSRKLHGSLFHKVTVLWELFFLHLKNGENEDNPTAEQAQYVPALYRLPCGWDKCIQVPKVRVLTQIKTKAFMLTFKAERSSILQTISQHYGGTFIFSYLILCPTNLNLVNMKNSVIRRYNKKIYCILRCKNAPWFWKQNCRKKIHGCVWNIFINQKIQSDS